MGEKALKWLINIYNDEVYDELLKIYYRLLEQEKIYDNFIIDFFMHDQVSESAKNRAGELTFSCSFCIMLIQSPQ